VPTSKELDREYNQDVLASVPVPMLTCYTASLTLVTEPAAWFLVVYAAHIHVDVAQTTHKIPTPR
jgi:hypothetical protein